MRQILYLSTYIFLIVGCNDNRTEKLCLVDTLNVKHDSIVEEAVFCEYKLDSIKIETKHVGDNFIVISTIGDLKKEYDLGKLGIPTKTPELAWINDNYACMVTWWSLSQSRHIFIPIKRTNGFVYLDKTIEEMDSTNNNIIYIESWNEKSNTIKFKVENLVTRKSDSLSFQLDNNYGFKLYDKIVLTKNNLTISTMQESKSLDIKRIYTSY